MRGISRVDASLELLSMLRPRIDLNLLVTLKALLDERSVTRAAAVIGVTQPAMSASLAKLRDHFDDPLIVAVGRRMELTPLAASLVEPLRDTLARVQSTLATQPRFDPTASQRRFSILTSDYAVSVLLHGVLRRIEREAPGVRVQLLPPRDGAAALLDAGEVDLLVVPTRFASAAHDTVPLFDDVYAVLADAGNDTVADTMSFASYVGLGHAVYDRSDVEVWFAQTHGDRRRVELVVHSFWQLAQVLVGSRRVALMPRRMARIAARSLPLKLARPGFTTPAFAVVMQWHRVRSADPGTAWLRGLVEDEAARVAASAVD